LHDRTPSVQAKTALESLDESPALSTELLQLGKWISEYYLAPVGEVFRSMLPLAAEFRRTVEFSCERQHRAKDFAHGSEIVLTDPFTKLQQLGAQSGGLIQTLKRGFRLNRRSSIVQ